MRLRCIVPLLALLLASCEVAPTESLEALETSVVYQEIILDDADAAHVAVVNAYDKQLADTTNELIDTIKRYELRLNPANTSQVYDEADANRAARAGDRAAVKARALNNPALKAARRVHELQKRWMETYGTDFALKVADITREGQDIIKTLKGNN